jgi:hypothetical protein
VGTKETKEEITYLEGGPLFRITQCVAKASHFLKKAKGPHACDPNCWGGISKRILV